MGWELGFFYSILLFYGVFTDNVENELVGMPTVECGSGIFIVKFTTRLPFEGHTYVKGHYGSENCRTDASLENGVSLTISYNDCDVLKQRSHNPRGLLLTTTIIISFHPMFVTKVDKSYKVQCFYADGGNYVTQQLNISDRNNIDPKLLVVDGTEPLKDFKNLNELPAYNNVLTSEDKKNYFPLPECNYQVLSGSKGGKPVKFVSVGQQVYHKWSCKDPQTPNRKYSFCATIHSCSVREEGGREVQLLDENGCGVDRYLLKNLEYTSDLIGGQASQVFKFADQSTLFFQCQIRLSLKENGVCKRSSDSCPVTIRGKRSTDENENDLDVFSQHMTVFDIDEPISLNAVRELDSLSSWSRPELCISPIAAGSVIAFFASIFLVSVIASGLLCCRPHIVKLKLAK